MRCESFFEKFNKNISLDDTRLKRIDDAISAFETFISNDSKKDMEEVGVKDLLIEAFLQGSYKVKTCTKPANDEEEFDVDVVLSLALKKSLEDFPEDKPKKVLEWLEKRLEQNSNYSDKTDPKPRCVRINYKGDFHMDIVPVTPVDNKDGILWIPDKSEGWDKTNPKGFISWCNGKGEYFTRIVKYLKWWRSAIAPEKANVSSILLTTLIGNYILKGSSDSETLVETMENLNRWLQSCNLVPIVSNPSLSTENLARGWSQSDFSSFKTHFDKATKNSRTALDEPDLAESIKLWQKVFGDKFPTSTDGDNGKDGAEDTTLSTEKAVTAGPIIIKNPSKPHGVIDNII